jgi:heme/copper-type cytochrome/quinol oxidase subunit 3
MSLLFTLISCQTSNFTIPSLTSVTCGTRRVISKNTRFYNSASST